jgi:hypothetical protein
MKYLLLIFLFFACHGGIPNSHHIRGNVDNGFRGGSYPYNSPAYYPGAYNGGLYNQYSPYGGRYQNDFYGGGYYSQGGGMHRGGGNHHSYGGESHHRGGGHHR